MAPSVLAGPSRLHLTVVTRGPPAPASLTLEAGAWQLSSVSLSSPAPRRGYQIDAAGCRIPQPVCIPFSVHAQKHT